MEVMRPAGIALDALPDPDAVIAKNSVFWEVNRKIRELDLHTLKIPKDLGGLAGDIDPMAAILITEQLGYADAGLAVSLGASCMPFNLAAMMPIPEMQQLARDFCADKEGKLIGCWAITEPDHGTDWIIGGNRPEIKPSVTAVRKGNEYIINGEKAAWISNGSIASHALLHVGIDASRGMEGQGLAILPLDFKGSPAANPSIKWARGH